MALVDPNIALGFRQPEQPNLLGQYAQIAQLQSGQQAQQLNALKLQEAQAGLQERNALRQLDPSSKDYAKQLMRVSPTQGLAYQKSVSEAATAEATRGKTQVETAAAKQKLMSQGLRDISTRPSEAQITAYLEDVTDSPLFTDAEKLKAQQNAAMLLSMPFEERKAYLASQGASASELKPTVSVGPTGIVQTPAYGGAGNVVAGTSAAFQMTPAQIEQGKRDQQRLGLEGQRVGLERERVGIARTEADRKMQGLEALPPKEIQKREAALPQATSAVRGFEAKSASFVKDLSALRNHPGLSEITGFAAGRVPGLTADGRAAQALYDKVVAKGGFQALQDMRDASKTGGALGNVSNQEGKQLTAAFAAIDRKQDVKDVQSAIDTAIGDIEGAKVRMKEAYDMTYAYKAGAPATATNTPPPKLSPQDKEALTWANTNPNDPRAAQIKQRLGAQ